ncbi:MAG: hypothetical protein V5A28_11860 [Haloarculaceae archaeon]
MGNRSLDDFLDADETGADVAAGESDAAETGNEETGEGDDVDPATATYVGRSGECAVCGATVRRRWESDDGLVCPECKAW